MTNPADSAPLPTAPETLLARLEAMGIAYRLYHHDPVFTVADSIGIERDMPGLHCRNLFLRDKKGQMILLSAANETRIDLKKLERRLSSARLSFASAERLWDHLGVRPGSVCPYAIMNDREGVVRMVLDDYMMKAELVNFHPLVNTMTIGVAPADLVRFITTTGHEPEVIDLSVVAPDE